MQATGVHAVLGQVGRGTEARLGRQLGRDGLAGGGGTLAGGSGSRLAVRQHVGRIGLDGLEAAGACLAELSRIPEIGKIILFSCT